MAIAPMATILLTAETTNALMVKGVIHVTMPTLPNQMICPPMAWMIEEIDQLQVLLDAMTTPIPILTTCLSCTIDSGATRHYCPNQDQFLDFEESATKSCTADGHISNSLGRGKVAISLPNSNLLPTRVILEDVFYSPHLESTLISALHIDQKGCWMEFGGGQVEIFMPNRKRMVLVSQQNGHYGFYSPRSNTGNVACNNDNEKLPDPITLASHTVDPIVSPTTLVVPTTLPLTVTIDPAPAVQPHCHITIHVLLDIGDHTSYHEQATTIIANGPDMSDTLAPGGEYTPKDQVSNDNLPGCFPATTTHSSQLYTEQLSLHLPSHPTCPTHLSLNVIGANPTD
jgi:hypothetical protein